MAEQDSLVARLCQVLWSTIPLLITPAYRASVFPYGHSSLYPLRLGKCPCRGSVVPGAFLSTFSCSDGWMPGWRAMHMATTRRYVGEVLVGDLLRILILTKDLGRKVPKSAAFVSHLLSSYEGLGSASKPAHYSSR
jgi:hypothetical protein